MLRLRRCLVTSASNTLLVNCTRGDSAQEEFGLADRPGLREVSCEVLRDLNAKLCEVDSCLVWRHGKDGGPVSDTFHPESRCFNQGKKAQKVAAS